ncbi:MAG TPA: hypothetical protein VH063_19035 [Gaiellaceae bacterium]|jgi:hypothetical protein|nr:hypothetical protein [Gaiellaceae bacterium]
MANGYDALLMLARLEQELVDTGRFDELDGLGEQWQEVAAGLPDPTPEDRAVLEEIELTVWTTVAAVRLQHEETSRLLTLLDRGRRAVGTYGGPFPAPGALNARG